jgi:hypothetical protein
VQQIIRFSKVNSLLTRAQFRKIQVIPAVDFPGHSGAEPDGILRLMQYWPVVGEVDAIRRGSQANPIPTAVLPHI